MKNLIETAREYASKCHTNTNHTYDGWPYELHLISVYGYTKEFKELLTPKQAEIAMAVAWTHDVIEDCRQTYNDVKNAVSEEVAEVTYLLTNLRGRTRKERANSLYYEGIRNNEIAAFVKICDRLANAGYSKQNGSRMFEMYRKEYNDFKYKVGNKDKFAPMWVALDEMFLKETA